MQFHQLRLTEGLVPSAPRYQQALHQMAAHFASAGASAADAQRQALGLIEQMVQSQAALLSYIDVFWWFALVAALMVPLALIVLRPLHGPRQAVA